MSDRDNFEYGSEILGSSPSFRPPPAFVQKSLARQARIKQMQEERSNTVLSDSERSNASSPPATQRRGRRPQHGDEDGAASGVSFRRAHEDAYEESDAGREDEIGYDDALGEDADTEIPFSIESSITSQPIRRPAAKPKPTKNTKPAKINMSSSPSSRGTSKAVLEIERLRLRRLERRQKASDIRKAREGLDSEEQQNLEYRQVIDKFRLEFARKRAALKVRLAQSGTEKSVKGAGALKIQAKPTRVPRIQVCVRKRPIHGHELHKRNFDIITTATERFPYAHIYIHEPKVRVDLTRGITTHRFIFDSVFDENATNEQVHQETTKDLVRSFFRGGRTTLFAYGQTGSGKTHTIFGSIKIPGIYEFACRDVFAKLATPEIAKLNLTLHVYFIEIYGGRIYDLFSDRQRIQLLEDGKGNATLSGHREIRVDTFEDMMGLVRLGTEFRTTGSTEANSQSSRSHALIQMQLRLPTGAVYGKFALVDLAGSERGADRGNVSRQARIEGAEINKSLLALKECIRALHKSNSVAQSGNSSGIGSRSDTSSPHIPFRASKLTLILRDSFIGRKSRTIMIAMINPGFNSAEHSLNTLRYADRVKEFRRGEGSSGGVLVNSPGSDGNDALVLPKNGKSPSQSDPVDSDANDMETTSMLSPTESHVDSPEFDDVIFPADGEDNDVDEDDLIEDELSNSLDIADAVDPSMFNEIVDEEDLSVEEDIAVSDSTKELEDDRLTKNPKIKIGKPNERRIKQQPKRVNQSNSGSSKRTTKNQKKTLENSRFSNGPKPSRLTDLIKSKGNNSRSTDKQTVSGPISLGAPSPQSTQQSSDLDYPSSLGSPRKPHLLNEMDDDLYGSLELHNDAFQSTEMEPIDLDEEEGALMTQHLACVATSNHLARQERALLAAASRDGHDVEAYLDGLERIVAKRIEIWTGLGAAVADLRARLKAAQQ